MKILHTADWHLGDRLGRIDRTDDLRVAVERIANYCRSESVDVLVVAGDLFSEMARPEGLRDTIRQWNEVFREFLERGGTILAITGNHDNESFCRTLVNAMSLAAPTVGRVGETVPPGRLYLAAEPTLLKLVDRASGQPVQFVLMPYPTPGRYLKGEGTLLYGSPQEKMNLLVAAWAETLRSLRAHERYDPEAPAVLVAHVHLHGSHVGPSLFRIAPEDDVVVEGAELPRQFDYVALGHIHKPQMVGEPHVRYCGSIERMDLGESGDQKGCVLVEIGAEGLVGVPEELKFDKEQTTRIYEVMVNNPAEDLPRLRLEHSDAATDLVNLHIRYTAGTDQLEEVLRELDRIFPRWYARDWKESGALGPSLAATESGPSRSFAETVREYLSTELVQHEVGERDAILAIAEGLMKEMDERHMIPQRVKLSGFLSYRDEQEVRFDGSQLWMLSGTNGSGKSSIFDAVTFALFGQHRGGSQNAGDLINKESNTLSVEFDFTVEKQLFRIKRTVRRQKSDKIASTQQAMRWTPPPNPLPNGEGDLTGGEWEPIPDTNYKARFDAWVRDKIGLDYETFTSSVLLLQGKSEKLLDSTPAGRAGVLARIVDLERYQKLYSRADDKRKELKGQLEGIAHQLAAIRDVSDEELTAAQAQVESTEQARESVERRIESLVALEERAREWESARKKLASAKEKLAGAEGVLSSAVAIEKDYARLRELRDVLPAVGVIVAERGRIAESERSSERLGREQAARSEDRRRIEHTVEQARLKLANLKTTLGEDEGKQKALCERLRQLTGILEKAKQVEDAEAEVRRLEADLKPLPAEPETAVRDLEREQERLVVLEQHVAVLDRLHTDRSELTKVATAEKTARAEEARLLTEGKTAKEEFAALEIKAKAARDDRTLKDTAAAEARALARRARELAEEFESLSGEKTCRACGQPLTPKHFAEEKKARTLAAKEAEAKLKSLTDAAAKARKLEEDFVAKEAAERDHLAKLRDHYRDAAVAVKQAGLDIKRLTDSCRTSYFALPDEFKAKFGHDEPEDWLTVSYPDRHALSELAAQVHGLDAVRRKLTAARDTAKQVSELRAKLESARDRLSRASAGLRAGDPGAIREEFTTKQADETAVAANLAATKKAIQAAEGELKRLQRDLNAADRDLIELAGKLNTEEVTRKQSIDAVERARKTLPEGWHDAVESAGLAERGRWQDELDDLTGRDVEKKYADLQAARGELDALRAEIDDLEREVGSFPPDARRAPEDAKAEVGAARRELDLSNKEFLDAQRAKGILDDYRRQRSELGEQCKAVDIEFNRFKLLAELLGRDRLQRHLVRTAEKQIVDHANAVLDRLSGGQLFLKLVVADDSTEKALELECSNRVTGGAPINVAFLSGSQRFRVAVALALGIGQYAGKQHRPIESVIIDEGFGCLDRNGRQVMIQELQNLRGHLECILLVSHQEEFAEAFSDGYHFELADGATRVTRFAR